MLPTVPSSHSLTCDEANKTVSRHRGARTSSEVKESDAVLQLGCNVYCLRLGPLDHVSQPRPGDNIEQLGPYPRKGTWYDVVGEAERSTVMRAWHSDVQQGSVCQCCPVVMHPPTRQSPLLCSPAIFGLGKYRCAS